GTAVVIVVLELRAHAGDWLAGIAQRGSGKQPDLFEGPVALVVEEEVRHVVVGDESVRKAVLIVIGEGDAHAAARKFRDAGPFADIFEGSVAAIAVERAGEALEILRVAIDAKPAGGVAAEA